MQNWHAKRKNWRSIPRYLGRKFRQVPTSNFEILRQQEHRQDESAASRKQERSPAEERSSRFAKGIREPR